ncbi:RICIN domain-containing protein [Streptantibioticus ferralitis]|uniref:RICIN domain-containing protein n=1 Tax=Streptantibioticus ferralitis TaxID=236510 RepID=A0ABT5Z0P8_9ACTN|nr:RICIN domain-containing protein [Streptantibioticus ferralitis]MDF2257375.1 RICIN domain-containing protein [Streptantibioticus ferralitis]
MSGIPAGRSYRLKNQQSNLYLNVKSNSLAPSARLEQWNSQPSGSRIHQTWHVFPLDFGKYLLANKASGLVVNIASNSTKAGAPAEQFTLQPSLHGPTQVWFLNQVSSGVFRISNEKSQLALNVKSYSPQPSAIVEQWYLEHSQAWRFEVEDEYKAVLDLPDIPDTGIGDIHRMTSYQPTPSAKTDAVEVGVMAYPFPLVKDSAFDRQRQARENPYYILRRYGYWERVYSYEHGGASDYTHTEKTTVGLTTANARTVEETTTISVSAEASFGFKGVGASLSTTISQELKVITTHEEVKSHSREVTLERNYQAGRRVTEAIWYRSDKYVLERLDGSKVLEWTTRDPNTSIADAYPREALEYSPEQS